MDEDTTSWGRLFHSAIVRGGKMTSSCTAYGGREGHI